MGETEPNPLQLKLGCIDGGFMVSVQYTDFTLFWKCFGYIPNYQ